MKKTRASRTSRLAVLLLLVTQGLFAPAATFAASKLVVEKDDRGRVRAKYTVDNEGRRHGGCTEFHENGRKKVEAHYAAGLLEGSYTAYDERGRRRVEATYRRDVRHGLVVERDERGTVTSQVLMFEGVVAHPRSVKDIEAMLPALPRAKQQEPSLADQREQTRRWIMAYRSLCGLPYEDIVLDDERNEKCQAAAMLFEEIGRQSHEPSNPGWPEDRFGLAADAARNSNLQWWSAGLSPDRLVHSLIWDSDAENAAQLIHRWWLLSPRYQRIGVGLYERFGVVWARDASREAAVTIGWVAFPPPGIVPLEFFSYEVPARTPYSWSLFLNASAYDRPAQDRLKVQVHEVGDDLELGDELAVNLLATRSLDFDDPQHTVIFRPVGVRVTAGKRYRVLVSGLQHGQQGKEIRYLVEFGDRRKP